MRFTRRTATLHSGIDYAVRGTMGSNERCAAYCNINQVVGEG